MRGQGFEDAVGVLEVVENAEAEGEPAAPHGQAEIAVEIDGFDADGGIEGDFQGLNAGHAVVVGGRVIDGADAAVERFEEEGEIAVAAAEIEHRVVGDEGLEIAAAAGEQAVERVRLPKLSQGYQPGSGLASSLLTRRRRSSKSRARATMSRISNCWMIGRGTQAPFPGCQGH